MATNAPCPFAAALFGITDPDRVVRPEALPLQPVGVPFIDPVFGTTLRRVSDSSDRGGFETQIYSQLQAFSTDSEYLLTVGSDGYRVRRVSDLSIVGESTWDWSIPRWHPAQAHTIVHYSLNDAGRVVLQATNVDGGISADLFTFPPEYVRVASNESFEELSHDGRWIAGMLWRNDGVPVLFALDLQERQLGAVISVHDLYTNGHARPDPTWGEVPPNWVAPSPLGRYLVVSWNRTGTVGGSGIETFDIRTGRDVGRVLDSREHGDLGVLPDGTTEYYMTFEIAAPSPDNDRPALGMHLLPGTATFSPPIYLRAMDWGNQEHISARGPDGVGLVTAGVLPVNGWTAFEGELFLQSTEGCVLRLAHHRSTSSDYWVQPRASISRDGRYVVFASDWGRNTGGRGDPYIIDLQGVFRPPDGSNRAPVLDAIVDQNVVEGETLQFTATGQDADGDALTFSLDPGAPAGASIDPASGLFIWTPTSDQGPGTFDVTVRVTDNSSPNLSDTETFSVTVREPLRLAISDVSVRELDSWNTWATFRVTLSARSDQTVTVRYAASDGTAQAGADYFAATGTLTFRPGETSKTITLRVRGDRRDEFDENFFVNLADASGAAVGDGQGQATIIDNDPPPRLWIGDVWVREGTGGQTAATFTVRLSAASEKQVRLNYSTQDGTALAGSDYADSHGTLIFEPGETTKVIRVTIIGDSLREWYESFYVQLLNDDNASIRRSRGRAIVVNDD